MKRTEVTESLEEVRKAMRNRPEGSGEFPLSEEEAILDKVWDAIGREEAAQRAKAEAESKTSDKTE